MKCIKIYSHHKRINDELHSDVEGTMNKYDFEDNTYYPNNLQNGIFVDLENDSEEVNTFQNSTYGIIMMVLTKNLELVILLLLNIILKMT